jgi:hypothetical protein
LTRAGREFSIAKTSLAARLKEAGENPDENGLFSTRQLTQTLYGSLFAERLRLIREEADKVAIANQVARGELLNRTELMQAMSAVAASIVAIIETSELSREAQDDLRRNLSTLPLIIQDQAMRQDKRPRVSSNGAKPEARRRGRPRKRAHIETAS